MRFRGGYLTVLVANGTEVRAHWSLPLPFLILLTGRDGAQGVCIGLALVIVCHELGHAFLARRFGLPVLSLDFHALGGACRYVDAGTPLQTALIAWGGVMAQAMLLAAAVLFDLLFPEKGERAHAALMVLVLLNGVIALANLVPYPPLDGARAWHAVTLLVRALIQRRRAAARAGRPPIRRSHLRVVRDDDEDDGPRMLH